MDDERKEPLPVEVITLEPGRKPRRFVIDHNNEADRKRLGKHCWWAFRNGVEIRTRPVASFD